MSRFQGAWPALITPFTRDGGDVNVPMLRQLVDYLIGYGVGGFYVCGSTGEGVYMTVAERQLTLATVVEQTNGRVPVIAHVGTMVSRDAVALSSHAQSVGVNAIASIIPPLYANVDSIYEYFHALGAAAPDTRLLTYIFGGPTDAVALMRKLMPIETVAGSKYTGPNMHEFRQILDLGAEYAGKFEWTAFSGMDEECLFAAQFGANGNIGSTLNYFPGVYREIHASWAAKDMARGTELQLQANEVTRILFGYGFMGAMKEVMRMLGLDCGQPRLPNRPFSAEKSAALKAELDAVDFFTLAAM
ncbi:MAG: dihydrodipicolinate synthase family protein [Litorilinea sp.]